MLVQKRRSDEEGRRSMSEMVPSHQESTPILRQATLGDLLQLPGLFKKAVRVDYAFYDKRVQAGILRRHSLRSLLGAWLKPNRLVLTAVDRETVVGVLLGVYAFDGVGTVTWLYVNPEHRTRGLGRAMVQMAEAFFAHQGCHKITVTTESAPDFYKGIGYVQEGVLKNHWWKQDFYILSKLL
jgi:ribosomal protein S18 acetylase RimI-like enzyme